MVDKSHLEPIPQTDAQAMAPATKSAAVTLPESGSVEVSRVGATLYVGTSGDIKMTLMRDTDPQVFKGVPAGWLPVRVKEIFVDGTTAKDLVVVW